MGREVILKEYVCHRIDITFMEHNTRQVGRPGFIEEMTEIFVYSSGSQPFLDWQKIVVIIVTGFQRKMNEKYRSHDSKKRWSVMQFHFFKLK